MSLLRSPLDPPQPRARLLALGATLLLGACHAPQQEPRESPPTASVAPDPPRGPSAAERAHVLDLQLDGREEEALERLEQLRSAHPASLPIHRALVDQLQSLERWSEALAVLDTVHRLAPEDDEAWAQRAFVAECLGDWTECLRALDRALELEPSRTSLSIDRIRALAALGQHAEAVGEYELRLRMGFDELRSGEVFLTSADAPEGDGFGEWLRVDHDARTGAALAHGTAAWCLLALERPGSARDAFRRWLELEPKRSAAWAGLATAARELGLPAEAEQALARARHGDADDSLDLSDAAFGLLRSGRAASALRLLDLALELAPTNELAHNNRGWALFELGRNEEALAAHERAIELRETCVEAHFNRGLVLAALGRYADAVGAYDRALELRPSEPDALYCRGNALAHDGELAAALESYDAALALRSDFLDAWCNRAWVLRRLGRLEESRDAYEAALRIDPADEGLRATLEELTRELDAQAPAGGH